MTAKDETELVLPLPKQDLNRLRNAIHNEVGVTKQEIREMVEEAVKHVVEKKIKQMLPDKPSMTKLVDDAIKERSLYFWGKDEAFWSSVQSKVATKLANKFEVDVKLTKKK